MTVARILGGFAVFLLALYPAQIVVLVSLRPAVSPSLAFWAGAASLFLSVLYPIWWVYRTTAKNSIVAKDSGLALQLFLFAAIGLVYVIAMLAIEFWLLPSRAQLIIPIGDRRTQQNLGEMLALLVLLIPFVIPTVFPIGFLKILWSRTKDNSELGDVVKADVWFVVPLYVAGAISMPLYVLINRMAMVFGRM